MAAKRINSKAIIFDLGKVVFDLSFDRTFQYWANSSGRTFNDIKNKFSFDSSFEKFERGEISPETFRRVICDKLDITLTNEAFDAGWCDLYLDTYPGIDNLLGSLKRNYKIGALTNTNLIHKKVWEPKYADTLKYFEGVFSSPDMQTRKPEKEAYQIVLDHFKVEPAQTLFLDDNAENIAGAEKLGIRTILVVTQEQMYNDLRTLGIIS